MNFIKKNIISILLIGILLLAMFILFHKKFIKKIKKLVNKKKKKVNKNKNQVKKPVLVFYHMKNCKFCKKMKPEWNKLMKKKSHKGCKFIDYTEENNKDIIDKHKVQAYPTIKLYPDGIENINTSIEHEGERTADSIINFVDENL